MTDMSNPTLMAGSDPARTVDMRARPRADCGTGELARAYRAGRLVCACVHVTVRLDDRLGLAPHERRVLRVSFQEPLDDGLRVELAQLVRRRGAAACRVAERIDPIEFVVDDRDGNHVRVVGRLEPPQARHGQLRDIEFELRRAP
jgi:hypothetical protein